MRRKRVTIDELELPCTLFLDQASDSGYSIFDAKSRLFMTGTIKRGRTRLPDYKQAFIKYVKELADIYNITTVFHEEVYDAANMETTEVLFYLKHAVQDMGFFSENIEVLGLDHRTWKSNLAKPGTFNFKRKDDKAEIRKWVHEIYPLIALTTQDEFDALGMGIAVMINGKGQKNFYKQARYNKKLPVEFMLYKDVFNYPKEATVDSEKDNLLEEVDVYDQRKDVYLKEVVDKMRIVYRRGYEAGGMYELELDTRKGVEDSFRRFLSHRDALVYVRIPKDYRYWGVLLLLHGESPETFETEENPDGYYCLVGSRKKRL